DWKVKIIDFGLALRKQVVEGGSKGGAPGKGTVLSRSVAGTLRYAPPEQLGLAPGVPVGPYSDVYAFGKTCCYALFRNTEPCRELFASPHAELRDLLMKCIDQNPQQRPKGFEAVLHLLDSARRREAEEANRRRQEEEQRRWEAEGQRRWEEEREKQAA